jgi:hypothetical protein
VRRILVGDDGDGVAVLGGKPTKQVQNLRRLAHRLTDVAKCVGEELEAAGIGGDVHVALDQVAKLGLEVDDTMKFVVAELGTNSLPDLVGVVLGAADKSTNVRGDGVEQPGNDALINHPPFRIASVVSGGSGSEVGG